MTLVDSELIPTGGIMSVVNTPFDFPKPMSIGNQISQVSGGYDHNFVLDSKKNLKKVAVVEDDESARVIELWANQSGVQFYTDNLLNITEGKDGAKYFQHDGLSLETQNYSDAVHHVIFSNEIYAPGQVYKHVMLYKFSMKN